MGYVFHMVENIVGRGENAGYQHVLLFPQCFQKLSVPGSLKVVAKLRMVGEYRTRSQKWFTLNVPIIRSIKLA